MSYFAKRFLMERIVKHEQKRDLTSSSVATTPPALGVPSPQVPESRGLDKMGPLAGEGGTEVPRVLPNVKGDGPKLDHSNVLAIGGAKFVPEKPTEVPSDLTRATPRDEDVRPRLPQRKPVGAQTNPKRMPPVALFGGLSGRAETEIRDFPSAFETSPNPPPGKTQEKPTLARTSVLPVWKRRRKWFGPVSFLLMVVLPTALVSAYAFLVAADQYSSEFHFSVRNTAALQPLPLPVAGASATSTALASAFGSAPPGTDPVSSYAVIDYLTSPRVVVDLSEKLPIKSFFTAPKYDYWARLDPKATNEDFAAYWPRMVAATYDPATGIAAVKVRTFSAENSFVVAEALESLTEKSVNDIENRALDDLVRFAQKEVDFDQSLIADLDAQAQDLRQKSGVIDPTNSVVTQNQNLVMSLRMTLSQLQSQFSAAEAGIRDESSPVLEALRQEIAATQRQIDAVKAEIAPDAKGAAMPAMVSKFENLTLQRTVASQLLQGSVTLLQAARQNALSQHYYVMTHVSPLKPTSPQYPVRWQMILIVTSMCFCAWLVVTSLWNSLRTIMP